MNIVFLHRVWPVYGGGETVTICLANEMVKRGIGVHVAYFKDSDKSKELPFIDSRIKAHRIDGVKLNELSSDFFISRQDIKMASAGLLSMINEYNIDIVHNQWWPVEFLQGIKTQTNAKIVKTLHMDVDIKKAFDFSGTKGMFLRLLYPLYRFAEKRKNIWRCNKYYKYSDKFTFLAPCFLKSYALLCGKSEDDSKLDFVYNPLVYNEAITQEEREMKDNTVLVVGRLSERHKKISRILEAWKCVEQDKRFSDWKLQIVGDGEDRKLYENIIQEDSLQRVEMLGFKQPLPYYKKAKIFLMTSAYEGFGMTLVEAQQNAVALLVMDSYESLHEIVENGENGVLVKDGDVAEFTEKLKLLMSDETLRNRLADKGLQTCLRFTVGKVVDKWEKIYNSLLEQ
ncbi:MAG: glycosyltransferase [Prevotella sp.]|nr:glycosyltransferase [Prevotella sp.]MBO5156100.1 glycosyltransferase [Prevotella sp.]